MRKKINIEVGTKINKLTLLEILQKRSGDPLDAFAVIVERKRPLY
jgi:hypothetical protein